MWLLDSLSLGGAKSRVSFKLCPQESAAHDAPKSPVLNANSNAGSLVNQLAVHSMGRMLPTPATAVRMLFQGLG